MTVSAPTDKRFRRVHVTPRTRRWLLSRTRLLGAALVGTCVLFVSYRLGAFVWSNDALTVTRITVSGNSRLSRGDVLSLLDGLQGRHMLLVNLDEWRQKLLASPWVADAALRRVLPGTIDVVVSERGPVGIARLGDRLYLLDQRGGIIDEFGPTHAELDLPLIDGLATGTPPPPHRAGVSGGDPGPPPHDAGVRGGDPGGTGAPEANRPVVDASRAALALRLLASLAADPPLARRVSQIDVSDVQDAVVILEGDTALVRVGDDQFVERLRSYLDLAATLRERVPQIDYVDVRFGDRVYVRPQGPESLKASVAGDARGSGDR
jgi:cell division protein FtsQ